MDSCSSLISTYYDTDSTGNLDIYVKLSHSTVREFLLSGALQTEFAFNNNVAHSCLARLCLEYFHAAVQSSTEGKPLARYAGHYWARHHQLSGQPEIPRELHSALSDLFDEEKPYYQAWLKVANVDRPWLGDELNESLDYTPLYCAVYYNFVGVMKALLDKGMSPNDTSGLYGGPLVVAALHGHLETVNVLLSAGAGLPTETGVCGTALGAESKGHIELALRLMGPGAVSKTDSEETGVCGTALGAAAAKGHIEVVLKLLESGASVHVPHPSSRSRRHSRLDPLYLAVTNGQLHVCKVLLQHGAEDYYYWREEMPSALGVAARSGRLDIVKALLAHERIREANCRIRTRSGMTQIQWYAASLGHGDILRELLPYDISKEKTLNYAITAGDTALFLEYLDQVNSEDRITETLQLAAKEGQIAIVRELLSRGVDPSKEIRSVETINCAVRRGNIEIAQMLIDAGASWKGSQTLRCAISTGRRELVEMILRHRTDVQSHLIYCAEEGRPQMFKLLLEHGADITGQSPAEQTSLLVAAVRGGSIELVQYLLDNGLQYQLNPGPTEMNPLTGAILRRHWVLVKLLLEHGADVNLPPPIKAPSAPSHCPADETPLTLAVKMQNPEISHFLMNQGAIVTPDTPDTVGTPLIYAALHGFTDLFKDLLRRGANPTQRGKLWPHQKPGSVFPLLVAAEKGHLEIIDSLMDAGVSVNDQNNEGLTALHVAATGNKNSEVLRVLVQKYHADTSVRLPNGHQPIHLAAARGIPQHLDLLLNSYPSINDENGTGKTLLHWAAESRKWDNVEMLLDRGAEPMIRADKGRFLTPYDAVYSKQESIIKWERTKKKPYPYFRDERQDRVFQRLKEATVQPHL
jgi:ankyrin repeat protein